MTRSRFLAILAVVQLAGIPTVVGAQRIPPTAGVGRTSRGSEVFDAGRGESAPRIMLADDSLDARRRRHLLTYTIAGAALGGIIGAALTTSYTCGEPQPGVICSSMGAPTGAAIGVGVGLLFGWFVGAITAPAAPAPSAPAG